MSRWWMNKFLFLVFDDFWQCELGRNILVANLKDGCAMERIRRWIVDELSTFFM
jgi:hypothetical protein